jgi:hypothetical protein
MPTLSKKVRQADRERMVQQIAILLRSGKLPSIEQARAAIAVTRQKYQALILASRKAER